MAGYDQISDAYVTFVDEALANPNSILSLATTTLLSVTGSVTDLHVVDVGCGEGYLARKLAMYARQVVGVDYSRNLLQVARERTQAANVSYVHDDAHGLTRLPRQSADLILCHMALMDLRDLGEVYLAVQRTLKPGGRFVFSITHPCFQTPDSRALTGESGQFNGRQISRYIKEEFWRSEDPEGIRSKVGAYHRPLHIIINRLIATGFGISQLVEPVLDSADESIVLDLQGHSIIPPVMVVAARRS